MSVDLIILVAAVFVAWLVFNWLIKVVRASLSTAITIAAIVLVLQLVFGIGPQDLWQQIKDLPQTLLPQRILPNSNEKKPTLYQRGSVNKRVSMSSLGMGLEKK